MFSTENPVVWDDWTSAREETTSWQTQSYSSSPRKLSIDSGLSEIDASLLFVNDEIFAEAECLIADRNFEWRRDNMEFFTMNDFFIGMRQSDTREQHQQ